MRCRGHWLTLRGTGHWRWVVHWCGARHSRVSNHSAGHSGHIVASALKRRCALFDVQVANEEGAAVQLLI